MVLAFFVYFMQFAKVSQAFTNICEGCGPFGQPEISTNEQYFNCLVTVSGVLRLSTSVYTLDDRYISEDAQLLEIK